MIQEYYIGYLLLKLALREDNKDTSYYVYTTVMAS